MIELSRLTDRGNGFQIATASAITDHTLLAVAAEHENTLMHKMASLTREQAEQRFTGSERVLISDKYDGEGVYVYLEEGKTPVCFNAPSGRVRIGFPALLAFEQKLKQAGVRKALVRCELALPHKPGTHAGISEVIRVSFSGSAADVAQLKLIGLDILMADGKDLRKQPGGFEPVWQLLEQWLGSDPGQSCHRALGVIEPESQVAVRFAEAMRVGGEGLVVRRLDRPELYKLKPRVNLDAVVIGFVEDAFEDKYGVTSLLCGLSYNGAPPWVQVLARPGTGLSDEQRVQLLEQLKPLVVADPLAMTDSSGRAVRFVRPQLILELEGEDLIVQDARERLQRTQVLEWQGSGWSFVGLAAMPKLTFPRILRLREDKQLAEGGARIEQIRPEGGRPEPLPPDGEPKVLRREVYVKGEMLRKLVVAQRGGSEGFPYVVFWTDYSGKRAEALKLSTQVAANAERAQALAEQMLAEGITKGFERV